MNKANLKLKSLVVCLILLGLGIGTSYVSAEAPEEQTPPQKLTTPEYIAGELIVKLKEGKTLNDIQDLNKRYKAVVKEGAFPAEPSPQETLKKLKNKLSKFSTEHQKWYWQTDKSSQEYKDYIAKIDKEKEETQSQIQAQEELIARLAERQKRAPAEMDAPGIKNMYLLQTNEKVSIPLMAQDYKSHPAVLYAEPNYIAQAFFRPNDPRYSEQWSHQKTQAELGWDKEKGKPNIIIAIIDSGVAYNHEDLSANIWRDAQGNPGRDVVDVDPLVLQWNGLNTVSGEDYTIPDNDPTDFHGHGTHVTGIAAAVGNNSKGVAGIAFNCKIMPVRAGCAVRDNQGNEGSILTTANQVTAINYATDNGADVINMSWGGTNDSSSLKDAINYAYSKGVVLVAASGNSNSSNKFYPASYDNVISVSATDENDKKASFSNYGSWLDVAAPGVNILSTVPLSGGALSHSSGYRLAQGTSMSSPYVTGMAGLVLSQNSNLTVKDVEAKIKSGVDNINDTSLGAGRVNVNKALGQATPADTTAPTTPVVTDEGQTTNNQNQLYASWTSSDPESGIAEYQYAIGTAQGATDVRGWTSAGTNTYVTAGGLNLTVGKTYYFGVKAKNGSGLESAIGYSDGIQVQTATDTTKPAITHTPITQAEKNKAITFAATVTDTGSGVKSVWASYAQDKTLQLTGAGSNIYRGTLAATEVQADIVYAVKAQDNAGNLATTSSYTIKVTAPSTTNKPPVAKIVASPTLGRWLLVVSFNAGSSTDPDGRIVKYLWNFGTGATSTNPNTSYAYRWSGNWLQLWFRIAKTYTATLTVTDDKGATGTATTKITVYPW